MSEAARRACVTPAPPPGCLRPAQLRSVSFLHCGGRHLLEPAIVDLACRLGALRAVGADPRVKLLCASPLGRCPTTATRRQAAASQAGDGTLFIGWSITGHELWATAEDAVSTSPSRHDRRRKTTAILSLPSTLSPGSGFDWWTARPTATVRQVLALARRFGRDDDVAY